MMEPTWIYPLVILAIVYISYLLGSQVADWRRMMREASDTKSQRFTESWWTDTVFKVIITLITLAMAAAYAVGAYVTVVNGYAWILPVSLLIVVFGYMLKRRRHKRLPSST